MDWCIKMRPGVYPEIMVTVNSIAVSTKICKVSIKRNKPWGNKNVFELTTFDPYNTGACIQAKMWTYKSLSLHLILTAFKTRIRSCKFQTHCLKQYTFPESSPFNTNWVKWPFTVKCTLPSPWNVRDPYISTLWPSNAIWKHKPGSTSVQVIACDLCHFY